MQLRNKIILNVSGLVVLSVVVLTVSLWWLATSKVEDVLTQQVTERLVAQRDGKRSQIEDYFLTIKNQVQTMASSVMAKRATTEFVQSFRAYERQLKVQNGQIQSSLSAYYQQEFGPKYSELNSGSSIDIQQLVAGLSDTAKAFQYTYISDNPHALGEKDKLIVANDGSSYSQAHNTYHSSFRRYLNAFAYYDIFIVDISRGQVVYSVYKELDFATSLLTGPYADSGLATAFSQGRLLEEGESVLVDFSPYLPSYNSPASFIASPIFSNGQAIGVLIFQMPVERINEIMTYAGRWQDSGMGLSGETYLVGNDNRMRSNSRFLIEDAKGYLQAIAKGGESQSVLNNIRNKGTSIGLQSVQTSAVTSALKGQTGVKNVKDYRDVEVISAYTPLNIAGVSWVLLSEIDHKEAFAAVDSLKSSLTLVSLVISVVMAMVSVLVAVWLSSKISGPIKCLIDFINHVATNLDFSGRYKIHRSMGKEDELVILARAFNQMMDSIEKTVKNVKKSSLHLVGAVDDLSTSFHQLMGKTEEQSALTIQIATAVDQLTMTSETLAGLAEKTNLASQDGTEKSHSGQVLVEKNLKTSLTLVEDMSQTCNMMQKLAEQAENVDKVLEVIKAIAEQTNLLALNAAIEAARAGEQGRGFAVVADEVRTLAKRTQDSTEEISHIISELQSGSNASVNAMNEANSRAESSKKIAEDVGGALDVIVELIRKIESYNSEVTSAASEQNKVSQNMSNRLGHITELAEENQKSIRQAEQSTGQVSTQTKKLEDMVSHYKVSS